MIPPAFSPTIVDRLRASPDRAYEAHLTVETATPERRDAFAAVCAEVGVKCVLIELAEGVHRAQPMTTSHHRGAAVVSEVEALYTELWRRGFPVIRVKLEALGLDAGMTIDDAPTASSEGYFEFHAKVRLTEPRDADVLGALCARRGAQLSRNDRKRDARGIAERFITLRAYRMARAQADAAFDALLAELDELGRPAISTKRELTIYDGRIGLDAGWLDPP